LVTSLESKNPYYLTLNFS
ncbi:hypothetical protein THAOC_21645, partial [Thalassiosira oceanica]